MILAATGNRYQLDQVEQAMKIQFPDDEKRHHDDPTDIYHNNILGGAVLKKRENNDGDLDALATAQEEEAEALYPWPQQTEHSVKLETNSIRSECHVVIFLSDSHSEIVPPRDGNESASSVTVHTGFHSAQKSKRTLWDEKVHQARRH